MQIKALANGTNKIIKELEQKHGDKPITLGDIAQEDRELVERAVGGKATFTIAEVSAGLVDAYDAIAKEDGRGFFRAGKNDGVVQAKELAKAVARNPGASPLYTRIAQRTERSLQLRDEIAGAYETKHHAHDKILSGPEYHQVLSSASAPYEKMTPRQAYETALLRYAATGASDTAAVLKQAWPPVSDALRDLKDAATAYTHEEKQTRVEGFRDAIRKAKDEIPHWHDMNKRQALEYGPTYINHFDFQLKALTTNIASWEKQLEETMTRPSIPSAERDKRQASAQAKVDELGAGLKFLIEDSAASLLSFRPEVMDATAVTKLRAEADARVAALQAELEKNRI